MLHIDSLMTAGYRRVIRPYIFHKTRDDPEIAHDWVLKRLARISRSPKQTASLRRWFGAPISKPVKLFGLTFPNQVMIAAGYDKDGVAVRAFEALGCGGCEVGTVTLQPQTGNPRPRQWRLVGDEALVNQMGFNNQGVEVLIENLKRHPPTKNVVGVSIGKSKDSPLEQAPGEYRTLFSKVFHCADYVAVNISSPNTLGLRDLQATDHLKELLTEIQRENSYQARDHCTALTPVLVKISPDLTYPQIDSIIEVCLGCKVAGIIATNTTARRNGLKSQNVPTQGGLSGRPLLALSMPIVQYISKHSHGKLTVIGVGGIMSLEDALRMIDNGAALIQVFTGLIYNGPYFIRTLARELAIRQ